MVDVGLANASASSCYTSSGTLCPERIALAAVAVCDDSRSMPG